MKIRPVRVNLFHADGQTDMTKLIVAVYNFVNAPKNYMFQYLFMFLINNSTPGMKPTL